MYKNYEILNRLCPGVEWSSNGIGYEAIDWLGKEPAVTKEQFDAAVTDLPKLKEQEAADAVAKKATAEAKLAALGLTPDDLRALGL
jgi:hypothetical protein